jgi:MYXO-CTERM domain-containing protein
MAQPTGAFMPRSIMPTLFFAAFALATLHADPAEAGIGACGDIHVEAQAECEVVAPSVECEGMCTPLSVRAACAAQLEASCEADCMASCTVEPGEFDCQADCRGSCMANCDGSCEAEASGSEARAQCEASCEASCDGECSASCDVELPEADCDASCEASCEGSCTADANVDCQVECQSEGFAECEAEVQGGCEIACQSEEGALFCDGEYIDHDDNLSKCVAAIEAAIDIEVMGYAEGEASCEGNSCKASAKAGASCALTPAPTRTSWPSAFALLAVGAALLRRRLRA